MTKAELNGELLNIACEVIRLSKELADEVVHEEGEYILRTTLEDIARLASNGISKIVIWGDTNE